MTVPLIGIHGGLDTTSPNEALKHTPERFCDVSKIVAVQSETQSTLSDSIAKTSPTSEPIE